MTDIAVKCFDFDDRLVRVVIKGDEPWFVAKDVCAVLGLKNPAMVVQNLDNDEKGVSSAYTLGGQQELLIVSESGLYTIILRSRAATTPGSPAHRFRKWVTAEVLPQIRKTGGYEAEHGDMAMPASLAEDRIRLDKIHYALRCYGPAAARALWKHIGLDWVPEMEQGALAGVAPGSAAAANGPGAMGVARFCEERLQKRPGIVTPAQAIIAAYRDWCADSGTLGLTDTALGKTLVRLGYERKKSNRIYYCNVMLKPAESMADA